MKYFNNVVFLVSIISLAFLISGCESSMMVQVHDFDSCVMKGNPVLESYPRQCQDNGVTYVEDIATYDFSSYCADQNVKAVYKCDEYIKLESSVSEAGDMYLKNGNPVSCRFDSEQETSEECKSLLDTKCSLVNECERTDMAIGGQRDANGCLSPAGYSWNESLQYCLREWELDSDQRKAATIATARLSYPVTVVGVDKVPCEGCFKVHLQRNDNERTFSVGLLNWLVTDTSD